MTIAVTPEADPSAIHFTTSADPQDGMLTVVHANGIKVGYISTSGAAWFGNYIPRNAIAAYDSFFDAMDAIVLQHRAVLNLAKAVRAIRPAALSEPAGSSALAYDLGYNEALRDVERVLRSAVGEAPQGEGYSAITR